MDAEYGLARGSMKHLLFNPTWPTEWTLYNILMAWYDYLYTGDNRFILKYYDELKIKTLMDLSDETGLISTLTGKQTEAFFKKLHKNHWGKNNNLRDIVDWPQAAPPGGYDNLDHFKGTEKEHPGENDGYVYQTYNAVVNALYYGALKIMVNIATDLNKSDDVALYNDQAERLKVAFLETFQDSTNGLINDGEDTSHKSQHANMFALTLTMEAWDKRYKPNLDLNHAWGGAPANIIVRKMMGVEPISPGAQHIKIHPKIGELEFARLKTSFISGSVAVECKQTENKYSLTVEIPGGVVADIKIPASKGSKSLYVNGNILNANIDNGSFHLQNFPSGNHSLEVK
ncbi:MAG: hypothetical protein EBY38_10130 [Flavobacteriaceae bacterium]|nr:hypothetical protein [Flavobacteriaceae bacterium]